ncbi:MAG: glycosyltransferase [Bacteroidota bacterium]
MMTPPDIRNKPVVPVSLITTMYNEEKSVNDFLRSVIAMTVLPKEIVIVDGGSKDRTQEFLTEFSNEYRGIMEIRIIIDPTCTIYHTPAPIAKGRNIAIAAAQFPVIAVTDAGCIVAEAWLDEITRPFFASEDVDFVAGWYEPLAKSFFEECQAAATFPAVRTVNVETFLPSSRSVAFRKSLWSAVGGYPELALGGEDTLFDLKIKAVARKRVFAAAAVVYWRLRPNYRVFMKLVYRYGFGDGFSRILMMNAVKNIIKLGVVLVLAVLSAVHSLAWMVPLFMVLWLLPFIGHIRGAFVIRDIKKYPLISLLKISANTAYLTGYFVGLATKEHPTFEKVNDHAH